MRSRGTSTITVLLCRASSRARGSSGAGGSAAPCAQPAAPRNTGSGGAGAPSRALRSAAPDLSPRSGCEDSPVPLTRPRAALSATPSPGAAVRRAAARWNASNSSDGGDSAVGVGARALSASTLLSPRPLAASCRASSIAIASIALIRRRRPPAHAKWNVWRPFAPRVLPRRVMATYRFARPFGQSAAPSEPDPRELARAARGTCTARPRAAPLPRRGPLDVTWRFHSLASFVDLAEPISRSSLKLRIPVVAAQ